MKNTCFTADFTRGLVNALVKDFTDPSAPKWYNPFVWERKYRPKRKVA